MGNEAGSIAAAPPPAENIDHLADQTSGYFDLFSCECVCGCGCVFSGMFNLFIDIGFVTVEMRMW